MNKSIGQGWKRALTPLVPHQGFAAKRPTVDSGEITYNLNYKQVPAFVEITKGGSFNVYPSDPVTGKPKLDVAPSIFWPGKQFRGSYALLTR